MTFTPQKCQIVTHTTIGKTTMPQFRLTQRFASDCKIKQLHDPASTIHPLDDWFIDCLIVNRKKITIITHGKSTFTFFIPYADAGGAKNMIYYFEDQLKKLFLTNSLPLLALEVDKLFTDDPTYTKTADRRILAHMKDFKRCAELDSDDPFPVDWKEITEQINNRVINIHARNSSLPIENFNALLNINLPKNR